MGTETQVVIPRIADAAANAANIAAIDNAVQSDQFPHIIAWGKWLGFTPETIQRTLDAAKLDDAPRDSLQKIDGRWLRRGDILNSNNLRQVDALVRRQQ